MASKRVAYQPGMDYLVGVDTPSGEARNVAATGTPSTIPNAGGDIIMFTMNQISSQEDLETALGISAEASGSFGLFGGSARFNYCKDCKVNSSSLFLYVSVEVTQAFSAVRSPDITPNAAALLTAGNNTAFQAQFGDMFVRGLQTGGLFFGVIEIFTQNSSEKETVQGKVSAFYGSISGQVSTNQDVKKTLSQYSLRVTCYIEGGDPAKKLPKDLDTMIDRVTSFPAEVQQHGLPYYALLDSYSILPVPNPPTYIDLQHQKDVLTECASLRSTILVAINDINYIVANPTQFIDATNATKYPYAQWLNDLNKDLNTIAHVASFVLNNPKEGEAPTNLIVQLPLPFPQRVVGAPPVTTPQVQVQSYIGMTQQDAETFIQQQQGLKSTVAWGWLNSGDPNIGKVLAQNPAPLTMVDPGSSINITVGSTWLILINPGPIIFQDL